MRNASTTYLGFVSYNYPLNSPSHFQGFGYNVGSTYRMRRLDIFAIGTNTYFWSCAENYVTSPATIIFFTAKLYSAVLTQPNPFNSPVSMTNLVSCLDIKGNPSSKNKGWTVLADNSSPTKVYYCNFDASNVKTFICT